MLRQYEIGAFCDIEPEDQHMNDQQREALSERYWRAEDKIRAIHAGKVADGDPAAVEAKLHKQQDEIEFLLRSDYFDRRDRLPG
jgi:hypothetical protein